jgi:hypothetical protein
MRYFDVNEIPVERDNSNNHPADCWCNDCNVVSVENS